MRTRSLLILKDGTVYPGYGFGSPGAKIEELQPGLERGTAVGEVVFNTAMSGYHEVLTDPSYTGQIVAMTYPHIGNYGASDDWSETGPEQGTPRPGVKPAGFVVRSLYDGPVPSGRVTLDEFLLRHNTPGITDIDTRRLTLALRDNGSDTGIILEAPDRSSFEIEAGDLRRVVEYLEAFPGMEGRNLIDRVGTENSLTIHPGGSPRIALVDCGAKANILRNLEALGCEIRVFPNGINLEDLEQYNPDAVFYSNGPGDPAVLQHQIDTVRAVIGKTPVLGICLGHQLIAEALGARTSKMKFGHHGVNHPVRDETTGRVFVTSQNHGFTVEESSLPEGTSVWFRNANDGSVEGIRNDQLKIRTAQFHPESAPGPDDALWIFRAFLEIL